MGLVSCYKRTVVVTGHFRESNVKLEYNELEMLTVKLIKKSLIWGRDLEFDLKFIPKLTRHLIKV